MRKPMILVAALALTFSALSSLPPASDEAFGQGHMGGHGGPMMGGHRGMMERGGTSWPDSLQVVTVSGTAIVDTSHFHEHYYLDEGGDGSPDDHLRFGPWWYEPETGAIRPQNGDVITVQGGVCVTSDTLKTIVVFEINGLEWRDPEELLPWSGTWMHRDAADTTFIHSATDSLVWMAFPPGTMMEGMMANMMRGAALDSVYVHMERIHPERMPGGSDSVIVTAYHVDVSDPCGSGMMGDGMMDLDHEIEMHLHYDEDAITDMGISEEDLVLKSLASDGGWSEVPGATVDTAQNSVVVKAKRVSSYYVLSAPSSPSTAVEGEIEGGVPVRFSLSQNTPNPFNAATAIGYRLPGEGYVKLKVYDALGRYVTTLTEGSKAAGYHSIRWDGKDDMGWDVSSGVYFYRLESGDLTATKKMLLAR